ncbi:hypothetical protein HDV00_003360 [Rhizophlyctis rosea]|nr:hypothetical protein HDV00_003360 [Rhizophlyctis rosea]
MHPPEFSRYPIYTDPAARGMVLPPRPMYGMYPTPPLPPPPGPFYAMRRAMPPMRWDHPAYYEIRPPVDPATEQGYRMLTQSLSSSVPDLVGPPARWEDEGRLSTAGQYPGLEKGDLESKTGYVEGVDISSRLAAVKQRWTTTSKGNGAGVNGEVLNSFGPENERIASLEGHGHNGLSRRSSFST